MIDVDTGLLSTASFGFLSVGAIAARSKATQRSDVWDEVLKRTIRDRCAHRNRVSNHVV